MNRTSPVGPISDEAIIELRMNTSWLSKFSMIDRLSTLDSASFDRAYMDEMVAAHTKAVSRLETQAASGRETAEIASESLPKVRHHLEMARELDAHL